MKGDIWKELRDFDFYGPSDFKIHVLSAITLFQVVFDAAFGNASKPSLERVLECRGGDWPFKKGLYLTFYPKSMPELKI